MTRVFAAHPDEIAAVIVEPVPANMGVVPPAPGFLRVRCASITRAHGALLIFDEVITGFRRRATAARRCCYGVVPDLTCLGKIIGGGLPVGAYGGRADVMAMVAPAGPGVPGGHALRESAGDGGGHRHAAHPGE